MLIVHIDSWLFFSEDEVEWVADDNDDKGDGTGNGQQDNNKAANDDKPGTNDTDKLQV